MIQENNVSQNNSILLDQGLKKLPRDKKGRFLKGYHYNPCFSYICQICNNKFYDKPSKKRKFCSKQCYGLQQKRMYSSLVKQFIEENTNKHLCKCGCGEFIKIKKYHYNYGIPNCIFEHSNRKKSPYSICQSCSISFKNHSKDRKFCSKKCFYLGKKEKTKLFVENNSGKHLCKCGCDQKIIIQKHHQSLGIPSYIYGHHVPQGHQRALGHKHTEDWKRKRRQETIGKTFIDLYGEEKAKKMKQKIRESNIGDRNPMANLESRKKMSATKQGIPLEEWKKFVYFEPYTTHFNQQFKDMIRERDGYTCQLCNLFEEDHLRLHKRKLIIHHINYDKKLSIKENGVTLCLRCNFLVNKDREIWTKHFQELLKKRYGYEYTEEQKIILDFIDIKKENKGGSF